MLLLIIFNSLLLLSCILYQDIFTSCCLYRLSTVNRFTHCELVTVNTTNQYSQSRCTNDALLLLPKTITQHYSQGLSQENYGYFHCLEAPPILVMHKLPKNYYWIVRIFLDILKHYESILYCLWIKCYQFE